MRRTRDPLDDHDAFMRAVGKVYAYKQVGHWLTEVPLGQVVENIREEIRGLEEEWGLGKEKPKSREPDPAVTSLTPRRTRSKSSKS